MRKAPSFQFYPGDYLSDQNLCCFTQQQHGAYLLLLCADWLNDGLLSNPKILKSLARHTEGQDETYLNEVISLFVEHPEKENRITHPRLIEQRREYLDYCQSKSQAGKASAAKRNQVKFETVSKLDTAIEHQSQQTYDRARTVASREAIASDSVSDSLARSTYDRATTATRKSDLPTADAQQVVRSPIPHDRQPATLPNSKTAAAEVAESRSTSCSLADRGMVERTLTAAGLPLGRAQMLIALAIERGEDLSTLLPSPPANPQPVDVAEPVEVKAKKSKSISIPKYQQPDRAGNPREHVKGTNNIWLSEPELARVKAEFERVGLSKEGKRLAVDKVDIWFDENPKKLAASSEHATRILDWGVKVALEKNTTETRNKNTKEPKQQFLSAEERKQKRQNELEQRINNGEFLTAEQYIGLEPIPQVDTPPLRRIPSGGNA